MKISALLTIVFTMFITSTSFGQEVKTYPECSIKALNNPDKKAVSQAKTAFQMGAVSFEKGDFTTAAASWEEAYKLDCTATLLLQHMGRAYEAQGELAKAIVAFQAYIERSKDTPDDDAVKTRMKITSLQDILATQTQISESVPASQPEKSTSAVQASTQNQDLEPFVPSRELPRSHVLPMSLLIGGSTITLVGGVLYTQAQIKRNSIENRCPAYACANDSLTNEGNSARSRANIGAIVAFGGLAVAGAGVVWLIVDGKASEKPPTSASIHPWIDPKGAGVNYQGSF